MSSNIAITKKCVYCGCDYVAKTVITRYCSHNCNRKHYKQIQRDEKINQATAGINPETQKRRIVLDKNNTDIVTKQFLSIKETANLLGASCRTIERLIHNGTLRANKVTRRTIICRNDIDKLFNQTL